MCEVNFRSHSSVKQLIKLMIMKRKYIVIMKFKNLKIDQIFIFIKKTRSSRQKYAMIVYFIFSGFFYFNVFLKKYFYIYIQHNDFHIECGKLKPKFLQETVVLQ